MRHGKKGGVTERMRVMWDRRQEERRGTEGKHSTLVPSEAGKVTKKAQIMLKVTPQQII